jgi:pyruvate formate lyase activating enzyme
METNSHCDVCIRECEKGKSFCQRRDKNGDLKQENRLCVTTIGYLSDKPIIHFGNNSKVLSIGSWGCNFRCLGCQNVNLSWSVTGENIGFVEMEPEEVIDMALHNDCKGICYTYNEPAILLENVENIASLAREKGLFNVFVTNSTLTERSVKRISGYIDAVAADIKSLDDNFYYEYCGAEGISDVAGKILKCIKSFSQCGCHIEVRTNIINGVNDTVGNYREIASWIRDNLGQATPWHITRFFPAHRLSHMPLTPVEPIFKALQTGYDEGLINVHTFFNKGCDCALENDLIRLDDYQVTHDCCNNEKSPGLM